MAFLVIDGVEHEVDEALGALFMQLMRDRDGYLSALLMIAAGADSEGVVKSVLGDSQVRH